jgi:raffinose/stachyose/melibiose transport system substrate-binding protein
MPVPVNDSSGAYGNAQISIGVPAFIVVDAEQSTEAQQQGAIEFLNWLVTTEEGAGFYVDEFQFLPAYSTIEEPPADQLSQQILGYASDDAALEWMNSLYPADGWPTFGASMQKYLAGQADRAGLAGEFEAYWTSVEG